MRVLGAGYLCRNDNKTSATFSSPASGKTTLTIADNATYEDNSLNVSTAYLLGDGSLYFAREYSGSGSSYSTSLAIVDLGSSPNKITITDNCRTLNYIIFEVDN